MILDAEGAAAGAGAIAGAAAVDYSAAGAAAGAGAARGFIFRLLADSAEGAAVGFGTAAGDVTLFPFVLCPPIGRTPSGCVPLLRDPDNLIVGTCERPRGGTKTAGVPIFTPIITNPTDNEFLPGS